MTTTYRNLKIDGSISADMLIQTGAILNRLTPANSEGYPCLDAVTTHTQEDRHPRQSVSPETFFVFAIADGIRFETSLRADRLENFNSHDLDDRYASVVVKLAQHVTRQLPLYFPALARIKATANKLVAEAQTKGVPIFLKKIAISELGATFIPPLPHFTLTFEFIDNNLAMTTQRKVLRNSRDLRNYFQGRMRSSQRRLKARARLKAHDAHGMIDALALRCISGQQLLPALTHLRTRDQIYLQNGTTLLWKNGHLLSGNYDQVTYDWTGSKLIIWNCAVPAAAIIHAVGRPVTDLVTMPFLTADMIVRSINVLDEGDGEPALDIHLRLPTYYFRVDAEDVQIWPT